MALMYQRLSDVDDGSTALPARRGHDESADVIPRSLGRTGARTHRMGFLTLVMLFIPNV